MYPYIIADRPCWPESTEIINCSQPGFTSSDACAFFFRHRKEFPTLRAVVIHLGTCDATSWEIHRGRYTKLREIVIHVKKGFGIRKPRTRLKNRLLHFEWNKQFDPAIESPEKPADYEFNLSRIVERCVKSSVTVVMIRPKANNFFLPGVGKGNFIFYRFLGIKDKISDRLSIPDDRFKDALRLQESGDFSGASAKYKEILLKSGPLSFHSEYPLVVANNYAVCAAENGNLREAEYLLQLLMKERSARKEILLFNLAEVCRMRGDWKKYEQYMIESRESDTSMYRIRSPYIESFDRVCAAFKEDVYVVDMDPLVEDNLYVDHTHPLKEGQEKIADQVLYCLRKQPLEGTAQAVIQNILYNPELSMGNTTEFFSYYRTQAPFTVEEISGYVNKLKNVLEADDSTERLIPLLNGFPKEIGMALEYHLKHPCFPSFRFLIPFGPKYPVDVGRFPEYFLIRHLIPYFRLYEKESTLKGQFSGEVSILRTSKELLAILPVEFHKLVSVEDPTFDPAVETFRLPAILLKIKQDLITHLRQGNQVYERLKSTIFWYFRESLRYGSHSRLSMRYDRTILEYIAEALCVASILNLNIKANREDEIMRMTKALEEAVTLHEYYSHQFTTNSRSNKLLSEYDRQLFALAVKIERN